ncbi:MAG: hypothetical protein V7744_07855 [Pseudomonadales bacterium]
MVLAHYAVHTPIEAPASLVEKYEEKLSLENIPVGGKNRDEDTHQRQRLERMLNEWKLAKNARLGSFKKSKK